MASRNAKLNGAVPILKYFDVKGSAEALRLMFIDQDIDFEDRRITWEEWPALKKTLVDSGLNPSGQLPIVELNGKTLSQSSALLHYFGKNLDLCGSTPEEAYIVDHCFACNEDLIKDVDVLWHGNEEAKRIFREEKAPRHQKILNQIVATRGGPFVLGEKISYVDYVLLVSAFYSIDEDPEYATKNPALGALIKALSARPKVAAYLASGRLPKK